MLIKDPINGLPGDTYDLRGEIITLDDDYIWHGPDGTTYAYANKRFFTDSDTHLGVGVISLPESDPLTPAAVAHDEAYSNPQYQATHPRSEADELLAQQLDELAGSTWRQFLVKPLYCIVRWLGGAFWENKNTRDR